MATETSDFPAFSSSAGLLETAESWSLTPDLLPEARTGLAPTPWSGSPRRLGGTPYGPWL